MPDNDGDVAAFGGGSSGPRQWVEAQKRDTAPAQVAEPSGSPLMEHNKAELFVLAEERGVAVHTSMTKHELIEAIEAHG